MKLKTFFISYILFLSILLAALSIVSVYLTNHQMSSLREQSRLEFERISGVMEREIKAAHERGLDQEIIDRLIVNHIQFHSTRGIEIEIEETGYLSHSLITSFETNANFYQIQVNGETDYFHAIMRFEVTEAIEELRTIQRILLYLFVVFSLLAAMILYITLSKIFKPLELVASLANKIAKGNYAERIEIKGKNELSRMADDFNQMAEKIENHIAILEDESARKQTFIDNLAHELRTPLTSIYGYAEYMQKANLDEVDKLESTLFIMEEADHMKQITNSMLELAKLRNYKPANEQIEVAELFSQVSNSLEMPFKGYQVKFETYPCDGQVLGQSDLIKRLISNLCINAAKACAPGVGMVKLKGERFTGGLRISVIDNGCGIAEEHLSKLMEPFYQIDESRNKTKGGTGLGLAIVKQIAEIHVIEILVKSEVGVGTEVKIEFQTLQLPSK